MHEVDWITPLGALVSFPEQSDRTMENFALGRNSIVEAGGWLEHLLLGSTATAISVLAIAATGAAMLMGRIDVRRGATVLIGCFLLFGGPTIAAGLYAALTGIVAHSTLPAPSVTSRAPRVQKSADPYDPYAGAAVPQQR